MGAPNPPDMPTCHIDPPLNIISEEKEKGKEKASKRLFHHRIFYGGYSIEGHVASQCNVGPMENILNFPFFP